MRCCSARSCRGFSIKYSKGSSMLRPSRRSFMTTPLSALKSYTSGIWWADISNVPLDLAARPFASASWAFSIASHSSSSSGCSLSALVSWFPRDIPKNSLLQITTRFKLLAILAKFCRPFLILSESLHAISFKICLSALNREVIHASEGHRGSNGTCKLISLLCRWNLIQSYLIIGCLSWQIPNYCDRFKSETSLNNLARALT